MGTLGRRLMIGAVVLTAGAAGYGITSSAHADRGLSQNPATWVDSHGQIDESRIPPRVAIADGDVDSGVVYVDPHQFYGMLGARSNQGRVPIFDQPQAGKRIGFFDLRSGTIGIDGNAASNSVDSSPATSSPAPDDTSGSTQP